MAFDHLKQRGNGDRRDLFRIFVYDCPPLRKRAQHPLTGRPLDFTKTATAQFRLEFHQQLKCLRKVALRLGRLQDRGAWRMRPDRLRSLLRRDLQFSDLTDDDFVYDVNQKGTDMRVGLDIASVSFILDPMWGPIADDLHEHVDGLRSTSPRPALIAAE